MNIILLQAEALLKGAEKVTPFSAYVYGFLVLLLVVALFFVWKQAMAWQERYLTLNDKALVIFEKISNGYEMDRELKKEIQELIHLIKNK